MFACCASAGAQSAASLSLDPAVAGQNTSLLIGIDAGALGSGGSRSSSTVVSLPRGVRFDRRATARLCSRAQAAGGGCPKASKIGFGRSVMSVGGFLAPGGETEVTWSVGAYLAKPERDGDPALILLRAELLGADRVAQLLTPYLVSAVPRVAVAAARVVPRESGPYGLELRFGPLPGELHVASSVTATPTRFELALGTVRRVRQDFVRHLKVRTLSGYRVRKVHDHRLVGYELLRTPSACAGSWQLELRSSLPGRVVRAAQRTRCTVAPIA